MNDIDKYQEYFTSIQNGWGIWKSDYRGLETCHRCSDSYYAVRGLKCVKCHVSPPQEVIDVYALMGIKE